MAPLLSLSLAGPHPVCTRQVYLQQYTQHIAHARPVLIVIVCWVHFIAKAHLQKILDDNRLKIRLKWVSGLYFKQ